ncbi:MAG: cytochrome C [Campylobacterota bacterium]|nr:cytochrome C [Campylobacterota bacterium]
MSKFLLLLFSICFVSLVSLNAAVYKGQRVFVKQCVDCHKDGQSFVAEKNIRSWKKLMKNKGKPLADLHLKDAKAEDSWDYFKSKKYTKKSKHLKQFLVEYAKDSGNVPACN